MMHQLYNKQKYLIIAIALCVFTHGAFAISKIAKNTGETWKILIYMQADNDLSPYAYWDLAELEAGLKAQSNIEVFIELDTVGSDGIYRLQVKPGRVAFSQKLENYQDAKLSDFNSQVLQQRDEFEGLSQKQKLNNFIEWANKSHPSDKTILVIWGHGEGYSSDQLAQFGGVAIDFNPRSLLTINEIADVLKSNQGLYSSYIDILAMDACLMQTLEVAIQFEGLSNYLIGSTQIQNFRGLPYHKILTYMQEDMVTDALQSSSETDYYLSINIPEIFSNDLLAQDISQEIKDQNTLSVVTLSELSHLFLPAFNKMLGELTQYIIQNPNEKRSLKIQLEALPFFLGSSRDISTFLNSLNEFFYENGLWDLVILNNETMSNIKRSILSSVYGDRYQSSMDPYNDYVIGQFIAFGLWFPADNFNYDMRIHDFSGSLLYQDDNFPNWSLFLKELYSRSIFILK